MDGECRRAALLDRYPLWLEAVERVLERMEIAVVGKTTQPMRALDLIEKYQPELFIIELELNDSDLDGIACLRQARERCPDVRAVVLSMRAEPEQVEAAFDAGAFAYVTKSAHPDDLASAVRQAFDHSVYLPGFRTPRTALSPLDASLPELTRREREILQLLAEGHSNSQLAKMLWVTEQTVKFHLSNIYRKLNVPNRTGAARWAQVHGLLEALDTRELVA